MNNQQPNLAEELKDVAVTAISAASKAPFKTAFMMTVGVGLARLVLFFTFILGCVAVYKLVA